MSPPNRLGLTNEIAEIWRRFEKMEVQHQREIDELRKEHALRWARLEGQQGDQLEKLDRQGSQLGKLDGDMREMRMDVTYVKSGMTKLEAASLQVAESVTKLTETAASWKGGYRGIVFLLGACSILGPLAAMLIRVFVIQAPVK